MDIGEGIQGLDISVLNKDKEDFDTPEPLLGLGIRAGIPTEEDLFKGDRKEGKVKSKKPKEGEPEEEEEEPENPEGKEGKQVKKEEEEEEEEEEVSPIRIFAETLKSQGTIEDIPEDFEESSEGIHKLIDAEIESRKQKWVDELPEDVKYFVDNWKKGTPLSDLVSLEASIESYEKIDKDGIKENEPLQKSLIRDYLVRNGWDEKDVKEEIEENLSSGTLETKAKRYLSALVKDEKEERKAFVEQNNEAQRERVEYYRQQVDNLRKTLKDKKEIIPGIQLTDRDRKVVFDGVTKFDKEGKNAIMRYRQKNPEFDLVTSYLALVLNNDFSKVDRAAVTKNTRKIKSKMEGTSNKKDTLKGVDINIMRKALEQF